MRPFRERNPLPIGIAGLATVGVLAVLAFNLQHFAGGTTYSAAFTEAAGLKSGEEVRIAGVKVGKVDERGPRRRPREGEVHQRPRPSAPTPAPRSRSRRCSARTTWRWSPRAQAGSPPTARSRSTRTTAPYDVVPALQDASAQFRRSTPSSWPSPSTRCRRPCRAPRRTSAARLAGLQKVSRAVASRDDELDELLKHSNNVTKLLADRSGDLAALVNDGGLLLQEINDRRQVINQLLTGTVVAVPADHRDDRGEPGDARPDAEEPPQRREHPRTATSRTSTSRSS